MQHITQTAMLALIKDRGNWGAVAGINHVRGNTIEVLQTVRTTQWMTQSMLTLRALA
jgi:hypothetical protein